MKKSRIRQLVRNFHENGMKLMLEHPLNAEELLTAVESDLEELIDFGQMELLPRTFVKRDFRHIESDVVLSAPLRRRGGRTGRQVIVYILIEHQSQPDRLMPLRILEYVVQVFNYQLRQWSKAHGSLAKARLQPVLPVVFYTGTRRWQSPGTLAGLVERGELFEQRLPAIDPMFISLRDLAAAKLESEDRFFTWVLRLLQQRKAAPERFTRLLRRVIGRLESMPDAQRLRWLELLSYINALIYHERDPDEVPGLQETVEQSVQTDQHRREVFQMSKSYADVLIDRGREEGREEGELAACKRTLLRQLEKRFGDLPEPVVRAVEAAKDMQQLDRWLDRFATATTLDEMGIE